MAVDELALSRCQWSQWQHGQEIKVQHGDLFTDKSLDFQWIKLRNFQRYLLGTPYLWIDVNNFLDFWCNGICKQTCSYYSSTQSLMEYNLRLQWLKIDQKCIISQNLKIKNTNLSSVCLYGTDFSETTLPTLKKIIVSIILKIHSIQVNTDQVRNVMKIRKPKTTVGWFCFTKIPQQKAMASR